MRRAYFAITVRQVLVVALFAVARPLSAHAQTQTAAAPQAPTASTTREEITAFAKVHLAVSRARDSIQLQLAQPGNKKPEAQKQLQEKLQTQIADILHHAGMTE